MSDHTRLTPHDIELTVAPDILHLRVGETVYALVPPPEYSPGGAPGDTIDAMRRLAHVARYAADLLGDAALRSVAAHVPRPDEDRWCGRD